MSGEKRKKMLFRSVHTFREQTHLRLLRPVMRRRRRRSTSKQLLPVWWCELWSDDRMRELWSLPLSDSWSARRKKCGLVQMDSLNQLKGNLFQIRIKHMCPHRLNEWKGTQYGMLPQKIWMCKKEMKKCLRFVRCKTHSKLLHFYWGAKKATLSIAFQRVLQAS